MKFFVKNMIVLLSLGAVLGSVVTTGCLAGRAPSTADYCLAYKDCLCRDTFGTQSDDCIKAADANVKNRPNGKTEEDHCQDLFEKSACYQPFPVTKGKTVAFQGGAGGKFVAPSPSWIRGDCARAIACCSQIKATSDRNKCIEDVEDSGSESSCRKVAGKYGLSLGSCDLTTPGTSSGGVVVTPDPEPKPEEPSTGVDGGAGE